MDCTCPSLRPETGEPVGVEGVVKVVGEVKKESHVESLPDRAKLLNQSMIEAGEVSVLQRCHDGPRERHGARLDWIGGVFAPLHINLRKDIERVLHEAVCGFESCSDKGVVNFFQGTLKLLARAASPLGAANEAHLFPIQPAVRMAPCAGRSSLAADARVQATE
jgi:hypothetical protein